MDPLAVLGPLAVLALAVLASAVSQPIEGALDGLSGGENLTDTRPEEVAAQGAAGTEGPISGLEEVTTIVNATTAPDTFWGIAEEPYRTVLFYVLISCSVLLAGTLLLLLISMCYARYRGAQSQRRAEQSMPTSTLPAKGSLRDRLAQKPGASNKAKVSHV